MNPARWGAPTRWGAWWRSWRARFDDRGSTMPLVLLTLTLLIAGAGLSIDIGSVALAGRGARTMADLAALDSVRVLDGSTASAQQARVQDAARRSTERNGLLASDGSQVVAVLGTYASATHTFTPSAPTEVPNAVQVTVSSPRTGVFLRESFTPSRSAVATRDGIAAVWIGTTAAALDTNDSALLNALLGQTIGGGASLSLVSWQTIANAQVRLGDLAIAAGLTPAQLHDLLDRTMTVNQLVALLGGTLAGTTAGTILDGLVSYPGTGRTLRLADIIAVHENVSSAADVTLNALDVLRSALMAAVGTQTISIGLTATVPGVTSTSLSMRIIEPPQIAIGRVGTTAKTAQVRATLDVVLSTSILGTALHLPVYVEVAQGTATIRSIDCGDDTAPSGVGVDVKTGLAHVGVGTLDSAGTPKRAAALTLGGLDVVTVLATTDVASTAGSLTFDPPYGLTPTQRTGFASTPGAALAASADIDVLGLGLGNVAQLLTGAITPVVNTLTPIVLDLVGLQLGVADTAVPMGTCTTAGLVR